MDRREMFGFLGAVGAGLPLAAADHGAKSDAGASPLAGPYAHFCGIHMAKKDPKFQLVTQHYCTAHSHDGHDDLFQCVLFDTTGKNAKLLGVEYIVSDAVYRKLPAGGRVENLLSAAFFGRARLPPSPEPTARREPRPPKNRERSADFYTAPAGEKKFWHAHTYEVLGGGLIAPGMAADDELKFMKMILTTWGKAWHTWPDPSTAVPLGEPLLIWSLMGDGQADEKVVAARDKAFGCSTAKVREERCKAIGFEVPKVSPPKSMDDVSRQWADDGDDKPTKMK